MESGNGDKPGNISFYSMYSMYYFPHFAAQHANKNNIRLVFDSTSRSNGVSVNDILLIGPVLLQSLVSILWKLRQRPFAFCKDAKEMFQVRIREEYRDSQRFLWRNNKKFHLDDWLDSKGSEIEMW